MGRDRGSSILSSIWQLECHQSWKSEYLGLKKRLAVKWEPRSWCSLLSCYDLLGKTRAMQQLLGETSEERYQTDPELHATSLYMSGRLNQSIGEYGKALAWYARAAALHPSPGMRGLLFLQTGTINRFFGNNRESRQALLRTLSFAEDARDKIAAAHALDYLAGLATEAGDWAQARRWLEDGKKLAAQSRNGYRSSWLLFSEGELSYAQGAIEAGMELMIKASLNFRRVGALSSEVHALVRIGQGLIASERWHSGARAIRAAEGRSKGLGYNLVRARILRGLSSVYAREGRPDLAEACETRAEILRARAIGCVSGGPGATAVLSLQEVASFLRTLDPELFEIICVSILTQFHMRCERTPVNAPYIDIVARQRVIDGTDSRELVWGVSCKRWFSRNVGVADVPKMGQLRRFGCTGVVIMSSGKVSEPALLELEELRRNGVSVDLWPGDRVVQYLREHDYILSEVCTTVAG